MLGAHKKKTRDRAGFLVKSMKKLRFTFAIYPPLADCYANYLLLFDA